jgi:hypothetical protein
MGQNEMENSTGGFGRNPPSLRVVRIAFDRSNGHAKQFGHCLPRPVALVQPREKRPDPLNGDSVLRPVPAVPRKHAGVMSGTKDIRLSTNTTLRLEADR